MAIWHISIKNKWNYDWNNNSNDGVSKIWAPSHRRDPFIIDSRLEGFSGFTALHILQSNRLGDEEPTDICTDLPIQAEEEEEERAVNFRRKTIIKKNIFLKIVIRVDQTAGAIWMYVAWCTSLLHRQLIKALKNKKPQTSSRACAFPLIAVKAATTRARKEGRQKKKGVGGAGSRTEMTLHYVNSLAVANWWGGDNRIC